ncbi:peptidase, partial [bacterium]|nr:peptidase [bacterium]
MSVGYFQEPAVYKNTIIFLSDDDLWCCSIDGGRAERLTSCRGTPHNPRISPDGKWLAFTGTEEGVPEAYVMPMDGGPIRRLTHSSFPGAKVIGWTPDSGNVLFSTQSKSPFRSWAIIYSVSVEGGYPVNMNVGWGAALEFGPRGGKLLGRFGRDPAQWKRYRGGRIGELWIDNKNSGKFKKLLDLKSNMAWPMWINEQVYFVGDHDGIGNIYSCNLEGKKVIRHTYHED